MRTGQVSGGGACDREVSINAMMAFAGLFVTEKSEKQKYIALADALLSQMTLRRAALTKPAPAVFDHRIVVAAIVVAKPTTGHIRHDGAKAKLAIGR